MSRYSAPLRVRALRLLRDWFNTACSILRAPIRRPDILLVTGSASPAKTQEVENRLNYLFEHLDKPLSVQRVRSASPADYLRFSAVAVVDSAAVPAAVRRHVSWVADLDYETNPADGWSLMDLGAAVGARRTAGPGSARRVFVERVHAIQSQSPRPAYIFGTGPSLQLARERSFADGTTVVCNTIVRDPDLWHHLSPAFLTAGDAIYHFGHTPHARAFRADALRRLLESGGRTLFVYPAMFDAVVRSEFREIEPLLVPVPWGTHTDLTVDLTETFAIPRLGNVLNNLLLPLGCTLSTDVRLWGFDGRAPSDVGFWGNSDRHAYPELMQSIRDAHPAFFSELTPKGNEVQYVNQVHGDLLDERLTEAEGRGFSFQMLHHSWTPTLQKRFAGSSDEHL